MYSDETQWISQTVFSHKDKLYGTNGYIRASISTQTNDTLSFAPPIFVINIKNDGLNKNISLSYQQLFDIYNRLQEVVKAALQEYSSKEASPDVQLHYQTAKSTYLTIEFLRGNQGEPVVRISISHGSSNSNKVIMPFSPEFICFINLIGDMMGNKSLGISSKYLDWCLHLPNRFFLIEMKEIAKQIPGLIKSAVVNMDTKNNEPNQGGNEDGDDNGPEIDAEAQKEIMDTMSQLNDFMGENMENIELDMPKAITPETEKKKEIKPEKVAIDDKVFKWLDGDFRNFEKFLLKIYEQKHPIQYVCDTLKEKYCDIPFFPEISQKEKSSLVYTTTRDILMFKDSKGALPQSFSINKYHGYSKAKSQNVELAIELMALSFYLRACRSKLENKIDDNTLNKAYIHVASTIFYPFIFSFITRDIEFKSIVLNKIAKWRSNGLFDSFEKESLHPYGLQIEDSDIISLLDSLNKYLESSSYDSDSLDKHTKKLNHLFTPDMGINEEQIINEILPMELESIKRGLRKDNRKELIELGNELGITEKTLGLFVKVNIGKTIPIVKFFEDRLSEIPENLREDFMNYLLEYNDKDYDLADKKFPYTSFGEEAIKALFLWKPETGEKFKTYKRFEKAVVESNQDKGTILSMIETSGQGDSGSFSDFFGER